MKKIFKIIIIPLLLLSIFLAPVSAGLKTDGVNLAVTANMNTALAAPAPDLSAHDSESVFNCDWTSLPCQIVHVFYSLIYTPFAKLAELAAKIMDWFISYSTNSSSYNSATIGIAWASVRDIANIFFIIALLYVAIETILGMGHNAKKFIMWIVLMALLINFSLFFTQVIVDGTNVLAKVFQNMGTNNTDSISVNITQSFHPQDVLAPGEQLTNTTSGSLSKFFIFMLLGVILFIFMIFIFISVALLFVARIAGLWIAMIFAPIAFVSYTLPFDIPGFGHKEWWSDLFRQAFLAPIFLFFLFIILKIQEATKTGLQYNDSGDAFTKFLNVFIPFLIVFVMLLQAKKLAVKYSGDIGTALNKVGSKIGGFAAGAVTGGVAMMGRSALGVGARNIANNDKLRADAAAGNKRAQRTLAAANYFAKSSYDARQTSVGKSIASSTGLNFDKGTGVLGASVEKLKGGANAKAERVEEKTEKRMKSYELSGAAAEKQEEKAKIAKNQNERAEQYEKDKKEAQERMLESGGGEFNETEFKANYEKGERIAILGKDVTGGSVDKVEKVLDVKEINNNRRKAYGLSLEEKAEAKESVSGFFKEWAKGIKKMSTTAGGLTAIGGIGLATGGLGFGVGAATAGIGGFMYAMKEVFMPSLRSIESTDKQIIASVRKGTDPIKGLAKSIASLGKKERETLEKAVEPEKSSPPPPPPKPSTS